MSKARLGPRADLWLTECCVPLATIPPSPLVLQNSPNSPESKIMLAICRHTSKPNPTFTLRAIRQRRKDDVLLTGRTQIANVKPPIAAPRRGPAPTPIRETPNRAAPWVAPLSS